MIGEVCFTCRRHVAAAESTHEPHPAALRVWCVSRGEEDVVPPPGVLLWVRDFDRRGNLNGWECVAGMLAVFEEMAGLGCSLIIKRDSDTRILDAAGMAPHGDALALMVRKTGVASWRGFGSGYALTPGALPLLARAIARREFPGDSKIPEDDFVAWTLRDHLTMLPHARAAFVRNQLRSGEDRPIWMNHGNRWEGEAWYRGERGAEAPCVSSAALGPYIHPMLLAPGLRILSVSGRD